MIDFDSIQDVSGQQQAPTQPQQAPESPSNEAPKSFDDIQDVSAQYSTPLEMAKTAAEGASQGILGGVAPYLETKTGISTPEKIKARAETNPGIHTAGEIGGFGAGALTDFGLPAVLGAVGEGAAHVAGLGEAATVGQKLASGAVKAATEMGLYQANDEATKAILDAPNTMGTMVSNVGLSTALGSVLGPVGAGAGMLAKSVIDQPLLRDFADRLAFRSSNPDPNEMIGHELNNAYTTFNNMGSEVGGVNGLKAQALQKLMPQMNDTIANQSSEINSRLENAVKDLTESKDPHANLLQRELSKYQSAVANPEAQPYDIFNAGQDLKRQLQEWGKFNKNIVPLAERPFRDSAKELAFNLRTSLEDPKVWGDGVASLQKDLNAAWTKAIPAVKDVESKFFTKVGGELTLDPAKLNTYMNQNGKATSSTIRQQMMGKFVDSMSQFSKAVDSIYSKIGSDNPFSEVGTSALQESLNAPSAGSKLADMWHDKLGASTLGNAVGAFAGESVAPGFGGLYLGKEVLGPAFSSIIKPLLDKYPNIDVKAFNQALAVAKNMAAGTAKLSKASGAVFKSGASTLPTHFIPQVAQLEKLDKKAEKLNGSVEGMSNIAGSTGTYLPQHAQNISAGVGNTIAYINQQRPSPQKASQLDTPPPITQAQKTAFNKTLTIAEQPLTVLQHVKDGTITPKDIVDLKTMYPDYYGKMSQQLMQDLTNKMHSGEPIPYNTRMGVSLFLGQPLDSTMTPQAIQSAQPQPKAPQQGGKPAGSTKKGTTNLGKSNKSYMTPGQSAESDRGSRE